MSELEHQIAAGHILTADETATLRAIGISSIEEAVALVASLQHKAAKREKNGLNFTTSTPAFPADLLQRQLPFDKEELKRLTTPVENLHFGLILDKAAYTNAQNPQLMMNFTSEDSSVDRLPSTVRLMDKMQPVRNQQMRGTCAAFSSVALREFYATDNISLSEQFFYWAALELDPAKQPGMSLTDALQVLEQKGTCSASRWPYIPVALPGQDEGQGPPPEGAEEEAKSYLLPGAKVYYDENYSPAKITLFKKILAGENNQNNGRPIVIGAMVFTGCLDSQEVMRTGIMPLPLIVSEETLEGGHAMIIVGYIDNENAPGGGYFIVRNSWGERFAPQSPEAPGHALMPYAYLEYVPVFLVGPDNVHAPASHKVPGQHEQPLPSFHREFCYRLQNEAKDQEGRLRPRGLAVIGNAGGGFMEDTPANRRHFIAAGYCWPPEKPVPERLRRELDYNHNAINRTAFCAAIDNNIMGAKGSLVPLLVEKRRLGFFFCKQQKFSQVTRHQLSEHLYAHFIEKLQLVYGLPQDAGLKTPWLQVLRELNPFQLYELSRKKEKFLIVSIWLTPLKWDGQSLPAQGVISQHYLDTVRNIVLRWQKEQHINPHYTCITVGFCGEPGALQGYLDSRSCMLLSAYAKEGCTTSALLFPGPATDGYSLWDRLAPRQWKEIVAQVEDRLHYLEDSGFLGTMSVEKLSEETGLRPGIVRQCFSEITEKGEFILKKEEGTIFVEKK